MPKKTDSYTHVEKNLYRDPVGFYHGARKMGGVRIWEALGTNQLRLARMLLHNWLAATDANPPCRNRDISLRQAIQMTLDEIERHKPRSHKTWRGHAGLIFRACSWPNGVDIRFADLTPEHCQTLFECVKDNQGIMRPVRLLHGNPRHPKLIGKHIAATTFNFCYTMMSRVCRDRVLDGYRLDNPMERARIKRLPMGKIDRITPTLQQFQAILTYMRRPHQNMNEESADMVQMAGEVGLGGAEIANLKLGVLDFEAGTVKVTRVKTDHEFDIPFYPWSHELWNRVVARAMARNNGKAPEPDRPLFTIRSPAKALRTACAALGFPNFTMLAIRRHFIYLCCWGGVPQDVVAELQGHQDQGELIRTVYDNAKSDSDIARRATWKEGILNQMDKTAVLFNCQNPPELVRPARIEKIPEGLRHSEKVAKRLADALERAERSREERGKQCFHGRCRTLAERNGLSYDEEADFKDQDPRVKALLEAPMRVGLQLMHEARLEPILQAGNFEETEKEQHRIRTNCQQKISKLLAVIRSGALRETLVSEIEVQMHQLQAQVREAESALRRIQSAKRLQDKRVEASQSAATEAPTQDRCG